MGGAARLRSGPSGPKRYQIVLVGLIAGLGLGFGVILLREQTDSSFGTVEEFEGYTNLPVLAAVPTIRNRSLRRNGTGNSTRKMPQLVPPDRGTAAELDRKHLYKHRVTVMSDPHSVPSEQYRILMLKILQWLQSDEKTVPGSIKPEGKILAVTSAAGGEGKSVTALNLSLAVASSIRGRVLLIDADLWRPRVSQYL